VKPLFNVTAANHFVVAEIAASHGGGCEDDCLLGCCADDSEMLSASVIRAMRPDDGGSKLLYQTTRRNIPEDSHLHFVLNQKRRMFKSCYQLQHQTFNFCSPNTC
jgi:hypothetical protein